MNLTDQDGNNGEDLEVPLEPPVVTEAKAHVLPDDLEIELDMDSLTLGDIEDLEEITGLAIKALSTTLQQGIDEMPMRHLRGVCWVMLRHEYPWLTFEECRDIKFTAFVAGDAEEGGVVTDP